MLVVVVCGECESVYLFHLLQCIVFIYLQLLKCTCEHRMQEGWDTSRL